MRFVKWGLAVLAIIAAGLAIWLWDPLPSADVDDLMARSEGYNVEIIRDNWGVPHIYGDRDADVAFGIAYANAEDDFQTIQASTAATRGDLARYQGSGAAKTDYLVSLFRTWETIAERYETDVPQDVKIYAEGYAAGLNRYAAENPDETWDGLTPFTAEDLIAATAFKTPFFYGFDSTLLALYADDREAEIALDPSGGAQAFHTRATRAPERGSNAIAVAPARSGDGHTRLIINSHQPLTGPVAWWEAHVESGEGMNMSGGLFAGSAFVLHGFNDNLGWANTVSKPDLADIYRLTVNPKNRMQYRLDGEWRDFEVAEAKIRIRLFGPFAYTAKRNVMRTAHGPVIEGPTGTFAVRYAGMDEIRQFEQYFRLNHAQTYEEFMAAMSMTALPSINYIYADKTGRIAFLHNGQYPDRLEGWDWSKDLPGDRSDLIWASYRPFGDAPLLTDPQSGLIFDANNTPFSKTDGPDNLRAESFPRSMGLQTNETNRSLRLAELSSAHEIIDRETLLRIKFDTAYSESSVAAKLVARILAKDWSGEPAYAKAAEHLAGWDLQTDINNTHAALGVLSVMPEITGQFTGIDAPAPEQAFREAVDYLIRHHGRIDVPWGEVNRLSRGDQSWPLDGAPDILRAAYPAEIADDGMLRAATGDSWIAVVEWDEEGNMSADVINQFGAATVDPSSPHYADQAPLFTRKQFRPALRARADIMANAKCIYYPGKTTQEQCSTAN
ncbi:acylase [Pacificimonas sp. WHA3]|uniref:Acylase n=1 Tax=Pacificimonas pallii TaxID=2827236 RepID=A0ABS6SGK7_9SPHN|nr:acylase [Pacificimonas pallii]MBV7256982.1 acylase [Pacificimonas pallii]